MHTSISREKDREWAHCEAEWCSGMIGMEAESRGEEEVEEDEVLSLFLSMWCRVLY